MTAFKNLLFDTFSVELSKQDEIEEWTSFIMSSKDVLVDPSVVVHTSVKGKSVPPMILPTVHSSSAQSISEPVLKQAATSASDNTIPTILYFVLIQLQFAFSLNDLRWSSHLYLH